MNRAHLRPSRSEFPYRRNLYLYGAWLILSITVLFVLEPETGFLAWGLTGLGAFAALRALGSDPLVRDSLQPENFSDRAKSAVFVLRALICALAIERAWGLIVSSAFSSVSDASTYDSFDDNHWELDRFIVQWILIGLVMLSLALIWKSGLFSRQGPHRSEGVTQGHFLVLPNRRDWLAVVLVGHLLPIAFFLPRIGYLPNILRSTIDPRFRSQLVSQHSHMME